MASVQSYARRLEAACAKLREVQATCSETFMSAHGGKIGAIQQTVDGGTTILRDAQANQFFEGLAPAFGKFQKLLQGDATGNEDAAITACFGSVPLASSLSTAASNGLASVLSAACAAKHDAIFGAMQNLKSSLFCMLVQGHEDWDLFNPTVFAFV